MAITKEIVFEATRTVIDPEVGADVFSLGLIYDAKIDEKDNIIVVMTLSTRSCPLHEMMKQWVKEAVEKIPNVGNVEIDLVWEPAWNIGMASDEVKKKFGAM